MKKANKNLLERIFEADQRFFKWLQGEESDAAKWLRSLKQKECTKCGAETLFDLCTKCQKEEDSE